MHLHISTTDGVPVYLQIVNQIKYLVASGRLVPGEQLPPVRKLAEQLLVNPNTIARAYRELETLGLLTSRRGAGVYLSDSGSPLAPAHKDRILNDRIDLLLAEAAQLGVGVEDLSRRLHERAASMNASQRSDER